MPTFEYRDWLIGLIVTNAFFLLLNAVCVFEMRSAAPLAYFYAGVHLLNGTGHTRQQSSARLFLVHFPRRTGLLLLASAHRRIHLSPGSIEDSAQRRGEDRPFLYKRTDALKSSCDETLFPKIA